MTRPNPTARKRGVRVGQSKIDGKGVFAERDFAAGEVIFELDDSDPVPDRSKLKPEQAPEIDVFIGIDGVKKVVFTKPPERHLNASCDPNAVCRTDTISGVRRACALRPIQIGDEITMDYAINSDEEWEIPVPCNCGSRNCRGMIHGNYFSLQRGIQSKYLPLLDEPFRRRFAKEIASLKLVADS